MSATVGQVLEQLEKIAPLELAEEWDNVGLLAGRLDAEVDCVLCALDLTLEVVNEAVARGAQLIVTHHPILFRGRKNLREDDPEGKMLCALIRDNIALIAMHTNFDNAQPGVNDALAGVLGLKNVIALENGMRVGSVNEMSFAEFSKAAEAKLGGPIRKYGSVDRRVCRVAVLGGAGEDFVNQAAMAGADVYITGEMAYHKALDAAAAGVSILEAGHAATEKPGIYALSRGLQIALDEVQYKVRVLDSEVELFL